MKIDLGETGPQKVPISSEKIELKYKLTTEENVFKHVGSIEPTFLRANLQSLYYHSFLSTL